MRQLKLQILSDLHLEFDAGKFPRIPVEGDVLCLLGDIGSPKMSNYWKFLEYCSSNFTSVLLLTGNHEYYGSAYDEINTIITNGCKHLGNIVFLNNKFVRWNNTLIIGTTLWSHIPDDKKEIVHQQISDYRLIKKFTIQDGNRLHEESVRYINDVIESSKLYSFIILTHHAPLTKGTSAPQYEGNDINCAFASNLSDIISKVKMWAYGHTHYNHSGNKFTCGEVDLVSNQKGYSSEKIMHFRESFVYTFTE